MGHNSQLAIGLNLVSFSRVVWTYSHAVEWVSAARERKAQCISTFRTSVYIVFANVPLTEACHLAIPGFKEWKKITPPDGMGWDGMQSYMANKCAHRTERTLWSFCNLQHLSKTTHLICRRASTRTQGAYFPVQSFCLNWDQRKCLLCLDSLWCIFGPEK